MQSFLMLYISHHQECLQDEESYIYLSAIDTLAALSLAHTDEVLPILIESFNDKHRAEMDRLKVGQVIVRLRLVLVLFLSLKSPASISSILNLSFSPRNFHPSASS